MVAGYAWNQFREINDKVTRLSVSASATSPRTRTKGDIDGKDQNILLVGNDDRSTMTAAESKELHASPDGGSINTDTMMIVHIPANGSKATLISLPRDSYVHIAGPRDGPPQQRVRLRLQRGGLGTDDAERRSVPPVPT